MRNRYKFICLLLIAALLLTGCMRTVDQMYRPPKRSEEFTELQKAIDDAMVDMVYCAPVSGENQQAVQMADLNADGVFEYLLFAKGDTEHPLRILIFHAMEDRFELVQTIEAGGASFDMVEYVEMDGHGGAELVFGIKLTDQLVRRVSVYTFKEDLSAELLVSTDYIKFVAVDLDSDSVKELFVLKPGQLETDKGMVELYGIENGVMERSNEMDMSGPADKLKRILVGKIHGDMPAVYVATTVDDIALITDVYAYVDGMLKNITFSNESGTSVKTMRNYYVYANDIDNDGVVELPYLLPMMPMEDTPSAERQELIRWYALTSEGKEVVKSHTYHNFLGGWYVDLKSEWASHLTVVNQGNAYMFYIWDDDFKNTVKVMTIHVMSSQGRAEKTTDQNQVVLHESSSLTYVAFLEKDAAAYGITEENVIGNFHLIRQEWKTGET